MESDTVMRPGHPRWREFLDRLDAVPRCTRTTENARAILGTMPGVDVARSMYTLRELGGYCDCAILYDVDADGSTRAAATRTSLTSASAPDVWRVARNE